MTRLHAMVCVKQVPMLIDLQFDVGAGRVVRDGVRLQANPLDTVALIATLDALVDRERRVTVVSMGPPSAESALRHALGLGADDACLITDPALAGSDTLVTARVLAAVARRLAVDLIVLGRHSIDAETGQTGAMVSAVLGWPVVSGVQRLTIDGDVITAQRELEDGTQEIQVRLPAVLTMADSAARERWPDTMSRERAAKQPIATVSARELGFDASQVGSAGSPTVVGPARVVPSARLGRVLSGSPEEVVDELFQLLGSDAGTVAAAVAVPPVAVSRGPERSAEVWAIVEAAESGFRQVSAELVCAAARCAGALGAQPVAVGLGEACRDMDATGSWGALRAIAVPYAGSSRRDVEGPATALTTLVRERRPAAVLVPSTTWGRDLAGVLCASLGLGLTGDAIGLEVDGGEVRAIKPALGGSLVVPISSRARPVVATVRSGALAAPAVSRPRPCPVEVVDWTAVVGRVTETWFAHEGDAGDVLAAAQVVIGVGRGVGEMGVELVKAHARRAGAAVAATRRVCEEGWLPRQVQVGLTGRSISPRLYIAAGVRGAFEHLTGVRRAGVIVAINNDAEAEILAAADYGIVADVADVLPLIADRLAAGALGVTP